MLLGVGIRNLFLAKGANENFSVVKAIVAAAAETAEGKRESVCRMYQMLSSAGSTGYCVC